MLVLDLERPERFYYILIRPNRRSWMAWGAYFLTAHGAIAATWVFAGWLGADTLLARLVWPAAVASLLATCYTGPLFAQARGRDLWQGALATVDLLAQALVEGAATLLLAETAFARRPRATDLGLVLAAALVAHLVIVSWEHLLAPSRTRHRELATAVIRRGALAPAFWGGAIGCCLLSLGASALAGWTTGPAVVAAAGFALAGSLAWEYVWIEAGQAVPLS